MTCTTKRAVKIKPVMAWARIGPDGHIHFVTFKKWPPFSVPYLTRWQRVRITPIVKRRKRAGKK